MNTISSFQSVEFEKKFRKVEYKEDESYLSDDESDCDESDIDSTNSNDDNSSEDEDDTSTVEASEKSDFNGMRVFDTISPSLSNSYFRVKIDGKDKYIHKQTAC